MLPQVSPPNLVSIKEVIIRKPNDDEESSFQSKGWWAVPRWLISLPHRIWNTISLVRQRNLRPLFESTINNDPYISQWNDLIRTRNITKSVPIMDAIFRYPGYDFKKEDPKTITNDFMVNMLGDIFPEHKFSQEDIILTCSTESVAKLRDVLHKNLNSTSIQQQIPQIQTIVQNYMSAWKKHQAEDINITKETRKFAANIIGNVILKGKESYDNVALSLHYLNDFQLGKIIKIFSKAEDERRYKEAIDLLRKSLMEIYNAPALEGSEDLVSRLKADPSLSEQQKLGLIFFLFIAGQETTASLLNYIIWQLALNPKYQDEIFNEIKAQEIKGIPLDKIAANLETVRKVFKEGIRLFTPAFGVAHKAPEDLVVEIKLENGSVKKKFINENETLVACPTFAGRDRNIYGDDADKFRPERHQSNDLRLPWLPFGAGYHICPGQWLAKEEIKQFLVYLIKNFEFSTSNAEEDVLLKGMMTLQLSKDIFVKLTPRN